MRSAGDSWGIATGVGATALLTAAARALEAQRSSPLVVDPFAAVLCRAAGGRWSGIVQGLAPLFPGADQEFVDRFVDFQAARTKFFDDFLLDAQDEGISQIVIPAAGLDSRAYRLADLTVYEMDLAPVLQWKHDVMERLGLQPVAALREVGVDLRDNWQKALSESGFDPTLPSAWLIEGLLLYLPADARRSLFQGIDCQSAPGSRLAVNDSLPLDPADYAAKLAEEVERGLTPHFQLIYNDQTAAVAPLLTELGWAASSISVSVYLSMLKRPAPGPSIARDTFVAARKNRVAP